MLILIIIIFIQKMIIILHQGHTFVLLQLLVITANLTYIGIFSGK